MDYDYKERKKKVEEILDNTDAIKEVEKFPTDDEFTYTNGYKAWTSAIFVDLRDSTKLISENDELKVAKVIRGFTSEVIEILKKDTNNTGLKEIGIRGDCVYAVYSTPKKTDIKDIANKAFYINTYLGMLNKLLSSRQLPEIKVGIGLSTAKTLAVKAGRKSSGINNLVWIGDSVSIASKFSDIGGKDGISTIVMSSIFYHNVIKEKVDNGEHKKDWWTLEHNKDYGNFYHGNIVKSEFNQWIENGMND